MTIPSNVDIHFDDFCKSCNNCEIELNETENISMVTYYELQIYQIRCRNREVCRMWRDKMRGEKDGTE